ncbi:hypothetical protein J7K74_01000 [Candidatus Woesearchaeota archaeon]|nr:hypothetical protein [Candidatus Woesearchaeota archaeon]
MATKSLKDYEKLIADPTGENEKFIKALEEFREKGKKKKQGIEALIL